MIWALKNGCKKYTHVPSNKNPNIDLISFIHCPARGNIVNVVENVPTRSSNTPMPRAKQKSVKKPISGLACLATMPNKIASAGVRHGEATVPESIPNTKLYSSDPWCEDAPAAPDKNEGMRI